MREAAMRLERLIIVNNDAEVNPAWTSATRTGFFVTMDVNAAFINVEADFTIGRDPYLYEVRTAIGRLLLEYEEMTGEKVAVMKREYPYRFTFRSGSSGCEDWFIESQIRHGFPSRRRLCHVSMVGKTGGFKGNLFDYLDLFVAEGFLQVVEIDGNWYYQYCPEDDDKADLQMQIIRPRLTQYEDGWCQPGQLPGCVTYLRVCREVPTTPPPSEGAEEGPVIDVD